MIYLVSDLSSKSKQSTRSTRPRMANSLSSPKSFFPIIVIGVPSSCCITHSHTIGALFCNSKLDMRKRDSLPTGSSVISLSMCCFHTDESTPIISLHLCIDTALLRLNHGIWSSRYCKHIAHKSSIVPFFPKYSGVPFFKGLSAIGTPCLANISASKL